MKAVNPAFTALRRGKHNLLAAALVSALAFISTVARAAEPAAQAPAPTQSAGTPEVLPRPDSHFEGNVGRTYLESDTPQFPQAAHYNVLPLDWRATERFDSALMGRPSLIAGRKKLTYYPGVVGLPLSSSPPLLNKSWTITADVELPQSGGEGMICTEGGLEGGIGLYLREGRPTFVYNFLSLERPTFAGKDPLPKGKSQIAVKFDYDGGGAGKGATVTLLVNGAKVAGGRMERTVPAQFSLGEGFDVGMDHGSAVDLTYELPFQFTGKIEEVRVELE